ncbi:hypothetical protein Tfer_0913 [Thermincola ferriacetica]|uniref:Uncharacterized protein n=1 Tax=Thermincola ferriacetica TaxID=281456 RepID=A0A0L6W447_9FIRM|nr:hypothetical protein [Thermincola ferriacetica]KNZ70352.1 hypothetical protein Tfer_0913 [Thermincola ferriacetica]
MPKVKRDTDDASRVISIRFPADHPVWDHPEGNRSDYVRYLVDMGLLVAYQTNDIEAIRQDVLALRHSDIREIKQLLQEVRDRLNNVQPLQNQATEPAQEEKPKSDLGLDPRLINALDDFLKI